MRWCAACAIALACGALLAASADARPSSPFALCRRVGTDDRLRPLPPSLTAVATGIFGLEKMPAAQIRRSTYLRCLDGRVMLCNLGANLPCGKGNTDRHPPGAVSWCAEHPNSDFIPMSVTGHDSIYRWRCAAGQPRAADAPIELDRRGFIARYWKRADPP